MKQDDFEKDRGDAQPVELATQIDAKAELIKTITRKDQAAFLEWIKNPQNKLKLNMPKEALRYLAIPPELLEIVEDPENIDVAIVELAEKKASRAYN